MTQRRVTVIGLGLIGASLGGALRAQGYFVSGLDLDPAAMEASLDRGLVDDASSDLNLVLSQADLVILAIPVLSIVESLPQIDELSRPGAVIMDVGSVKGPVVEAMEALPGSARMIGGHPIAGKEQSGPGVADVSLFKGRSFALVPNDATSTPTKQAAKSIVRAVGGAPVVLSAPEHDRMVATTSHLPQLLAMALALSLEPSAMRLAGPGLRDMTRLAGSGASMWTDILVSNADNIAAALGICVAQLQNLSTLASAGDTAALERIMALANERSAAIADSVAS